MPNILVRGSVHLCKSATVSHVVIQAWSTTGIWTPTSHPHVNRAPQEEPKSTHHFLSPGSASRWKLVGGTWHHIGWMVEDFFIFAFVLIITVCSAIEADFLLQKNGWENYFIFWLEKHLELFMHSNLHRVCCDVAIMSGVEARGEGETGVISVLKLSVC